MTRPRPSLISVVVPFLNAEKYIAEAIESILVQADPNFEVLAVDDGSTDSGPERVRRFGRSVKMITQHNQGTAAALNHGLQEARGELIAFLDADDVWAEKKLARQRAFMQAKPGCDFVFGLMQNFISLDLPAEQKLGLQCSLTPMAGYCPGTRLVRREAFDRVGLFADKWRVGEFMDWFIRALDLNLRFELMPELVLKRRIHSENKSRLLSSAREDYLAIIKQSLDRRRSR